MFELKSPKAPAILIDGVESNRNNPETFHIPPLSKRTTAKVGEFVKVGIESSEIGHEKFWVEIIAVIDNGNYVGRVDNDLAQGWGFNCDDHIEFEPRHLLANQ